MALDGFRRFINKAKKFKAEEVVHKVIEVEAKDILNAMKLQLSKGIDGNGNSVYLIRPFPIGVKRYSYSRRTIRKKDLIGSGLGSETDRITNYMSGRFYNSLYVEQLSGDNFEILSSSPLFELIKIRSGEDILKLSPEYERILFEEKMAPLIQEEINELFYDI